jgi:hypothetical protein
VQRGLGVTEKVVVLELGRRDKQAVKQHAQKDEPA